MSTSTFIPARRRQKQKCPLRAAEFFAGIGLVRLALEKHGWKVVFANDIDPDKQEMYTANFGPDHFHLGDIHKLSPADIPDCELFTASFPCNDLSAIDRWKPLTPSPGTPGEGWGEGSYNTNHFPEHP